MTAKPYDTGSKWLIQHFADALLRLAGVTGVRSWTPLPGEVSQSRQLPDGLVEVTLDGSDEPALFLIEVNTYPENRLVEELLDDILLTYLDRRRVPEVVVVVMHPKGQVRIGQDVELASLLGWTRFAAAWRVINLWEMPASDLLSLTGAGIAPWIPLMRIEEPARSVMLHCKAVIESEPDAVRRQNLMTIAMVFASLRYDAAEVRALYAPEPTMIESPLLTEWLQEQDIRTQQKVVRRALETRFGMVPEDILAELRAERDEGRLETLTASAYQCPDLAAFRAALAAN